MTEIPVRSSRPSRAAARHRERAGVDRAYLRYAVIGDSSSRGRRSASTSWAWRLADALARGNALSLCDATRRGATAYDTRRVQLREAVAHRPNLVALTPGLADIGRRDWDGDAVRAHLLHCAMVLSQHDAIVLTVRLDPSQRGLDLIRPTRSRRRARIESINGVFAEIERRYGGVHLVPAGRSQSSSRAGRRAEATIERFCAALGARGFLVG